MSTALAIAATTRVLTALISQNVDQANLSGLLAAAHTSASPPDRIVTGDQELTHLNLFLYHVTLNQGWREEGLPSRNASGARTDRPLLAVDLHYILTAYGAGDYEQQILLGLGMQALHETPFLSRQEIRTIFTPPPALTPVDKALATAGIDQQVELIKVTPEHLSTEDLSRLWTAFGGKFRSGAGYAVTTLLVESSATIQTALPVLRRAFAVIPFSEPHIAAVDPQFIDWRPGSIEATLTGENLTGEGVVVVFDGNPKLPQTPRSLAAGGAKVAVTLPPLPAGINTVRVVRQVEIGAPPARNVVESNMAMFFLRPVILPSPTPPSNGVVTVAVSPAVDPSQRVQLLLNERNPPAGTAALSLTFDAKPAQILPNKVGFSTFGARPGVYLVRVRVDGAESTLRVDPATRQFVAPVVTL